MQKGRLFVVSGPSGAGKGTICNELIESGVGTLSISMTTRAIRGKEIPDVSYYFVSDEEFDRTIAEGGFLEYAGVYGHRYGTPKKPVLEAMDRGEDVILEIEMQGAMNVKKSYPDAITIFVLPPSLHVLADRLSGRNSDSPDQIRQRTEAVLNELKKIVDYDYFVINDKLEDAVEMVKAIIKAAHGDSEAEKFSSSNRVNAQTISVTDKYYREAK